MKNMNITDWKEVAAKASKAFFSDMSVCNSPHNTDDLLTKFSHKLSAYGH